MVRRGNVCARRKSVCLLGGCRWDIRVVCGVDVLNERLENTPLSLLDTVTEHDEVDGYVVLLQSLGELDHELLICGLVLERRGDEDYYALAKILVRSVLEGKQGFLDGIGDVAGSAELVLRGVDGAEYCADLLGIRYEYFWTALRVST